MSLTGMEHQVLWAIAGTRNIVLDHLFLMYTEAGDSGAIWIAGALALMAPRNTRRVGILMLIAMVVSSLLGEGLLKHLISRPRPFITFPEGPAVIGPLPDGWSFPSGHTSAAFAFAMVIGYFYKSGRWAWLLAAGMALSRLYVGVHYPSDVVGGAALGALSGWLVISVHGVIYKKRGWSRS